MQGDAGGWFVGWKGVWDGKVCGVERFVGWKGLGWLFVEVRACGWCEELVRRPDVQKR